MGRSGSSDRLPPITSRSWISSSQIKAIYALRFSKMGSSNAVKQFGEKPAGLHKVGLIGKRILPWMRTHFLVSVSPPILNLARIKQRQY